MLWFWVEMWEGVRWGIGDRSITWDEEEDAYVPPFIAMVTEEL